LYARFTASADAPGETPRVKYRASSSGVNARSRAERGARRGSRREARGRGAPNERPSAQRRATCAIGGEERPRAADVTEGRSCHASAGDSPAGVAGPDFRGNRRSTVHHSGTRVTRFSRGVASKFPLWKGVSGPTSGQAGPFSDTRPRPLERVAPGSDPRRTPSSRAIVGRCAREPKRASSVAVPPPHPKVVRERFLGRRYFFATGAPARSSRASGTPTVGAESALERANRLAVSRSTPRAC
jgi:hypothetical protein